MSSDELIKKLKLAGWVHVRTRGSHHVFEKDGEITPIVVPHPTKDLATGTLHKILKRLNK